MLNEIISGIISGLLISLGGAALLSCDNRYVGALLFSLALLSICVLCYSLFTGKVCYMVDSHKKEDFCRLFLCLIGNIIGTFFFGTLISIALPELEIKAFEFATGKMLSQTAPITFMRAAFCGVFIYLAVEIFRKQNLAGIFFCVPAFILCGFEHSIADMYYFAAAGIFTQASFSYLLYVVIGNNVGGIFIPILRLGMSKE